jgi:ribosomal-protein-alanine N-acetyltransferase
MGFSLLTDDEIQQPFTLRSMEMKDIPAVMAIEQRAFPSPWPESAYRYELRARRNSMFYVLESPEGTAQSRSWPERLLGRDSLQERMLIGYVGVRILEDRAHIATLAVHPNWRGKRLGKYLLLVALEQAFQKGKRRVTLEVRTSNRVAHRLYTGLGFVCTGERRGYYQNGEDAWLMTLGPLEAEGIARLQEELQAVEVELHEQFAHEGR